jgi:hypothetical protein
MMDMPTSCPECGAIVEFNSMVTTFEKICYHSLVCEDCYEDLESDNEV